MKKNIALVAGGNSSEYEVSLRSAAGLYPLFDKEKYNVTTVTLRGKDWQARISDTENCPIDKNDFSFTQHGVKTVFDFAYITIHGTPGENGLLQGYFDMLQIPYSCCDVLVSSLTFNKFACNRYLSSFGVRVADAILLRKGQSISAREVMERIGLPCFVKSNVGGSSFGVTKVKSEEQLRPAIETAFAEGDEVILETYMPGTEITCGIYKTASGTTVLPVTEVVSANEFFDYDAKYNGQVQEITPARLSEELTRRVQQLTAHIYDILGCKGIVRIDYIITEGEIINLLEINTTPGMTATSFIPQQIRAAGLDIKQVLTDIIEDNTGNS